jgi:hypothetical protein
MFRFSSKTALPMLLGAALLMGSTTGCKVTKTQEGEAPKVEVKGGQMPKYDVKTPTVDVHSEKKDVNVPQVNVTSEKREIKVPKVDVKPPQ